MKELVDYKALKHEIEGCKRPLYFFHDDPDGLCSFLLLYKFIREGKGVVIKTHPNITTNFLKIVEDYAPDKMFILDIAMVEQDFIDEVHDRLKIPLVWVDHHEPQKRHNIIYFNPRKADPGIYMPATAVCYEALKDSIPQYIWIAGVGVLSDYSMPLFIGELREKYPELIGDKTKLDDIVYGSVISDLIDMFAFILKGNTDYVKKCIKVMTRIEHPDELMNSTTPGGAFILKRYSKVKEEFDAIFKRACEKAKNEKDKLFVFIYKEKEMSFSSNLSNKVSYLFPGKIVIIGREKGDEIKCSLRSRDQPVLPLVKKAIEGFEATGGGHELASAAIVKIKDFEEFLRRIRQGIN